MLPPTLARGLLMLNPDTSEDITEDTVVMDMVDTEETTTVELLHDTVVMDMVDTEDTTTVE